MTLEQHLPLFKFLAALPRKTDFNYRDPELIQVNTKRALNYALCHPPAKSNDFASGADYTPVLLPGVDDAILPHSWDENDMFQHDISYKQFFDFLEEGKPEIPVHTGRPCGRTFKYGEPVYRCAECGFDESCVLCVHCFNKKDHEGHVIETSIAGTSSGGRCDCGDPEAWTRELHCKCNETAATKEGSDDNSGEAKVFNSPEFQQHLEDVVTACFSYIIGTLSYSTETLPFFVRRVKFFDRFEFYNNLQSHSRRSWLDDNFRIKPEISNDYLLLLWNDEDHPYDYAKSTIAAAAKCSDEKADSAARRIDETGRDVLLASSHPLTLYDTYKEIHQPSRFCDEGLVPSIMNKYNYQQEEICYHISQWLLDLLNHPSFRLRKLARKAVINSFMTELPMLLEDEFDEFDVQERMERGLLTTHGEIPQSNEELKLATNESIVKVDRSKIISYLMYFDIRFVKKLRKNVRSLIVDSLVTDLDFKNKFLYEYVNLYSNILYLLKIDREYEATIMRDIVSQLFSSPSASATIIEEGLFSKMLVAALELFKANTTEDNKWRSIQDSAYNTVMSVSRYLGAISNCLVDFQFISDKTPVELKHRFYDSLTVDALVRILSLFQSSYKMQRRVGTHVEVESRFSSILLGILEPLLKVLSTMYNGSEFTSNAYVKGDRAELVEEAFNTFFSHYNDSVDPAKHKTVVYNGGEYEIYDFKVSQENVGLFNPLNSLLSMLAENNDISVLSNHIKKAKNIFDFDYVYEISLRSIVLAGQIGARFWIRNGMNILFLQNSYSSLTSGLNCSAHGYMRDLHLVQLAFYLSKNPSQILMNIIDRWELRELLAAADEESVGYSNTVYGDKIDYVIYEFLLFVYRIITERKFFIPQTSIEKKRTSIYYIILYTLSTGPVTYNKINKEINVEDAGSLIQETLDEVADYKPPVGLTDRGTFSLKEEYYAELDPFNMFSPSVEEVFVSVRARILSFEQKKAKELGIESKLKDIDDIVLSPRFIVLKNADFGKYTDIIRSDLFKQVLSKLASFLVKNNNDAILPLFLHLLHAVILDNNNVKGESFYTEAYTSWSASLFSILQNPKVSKASKSKANFLLQHIIGKNESAVFGHLEKCFSAEEMAKFKESCDQSHQDEEKLKRRKLIEEKKRRAFAKLASQRKQFEENYNKENKKSDEDEYMEHDEHDADDFNDEYLNGSHRSCILCQKKQDISEPFLLIVGITQHNSFWKLPDDNGTFKQAFERWDNSVSLDDFQKQNGKLFPYISDTDVKRNAPNFQYKNILTSCNHGMHYSCLKAHHIEDTMSFYTCPLCQFYGGAVIPCGMSNKLHTDFIDYLMQDAPDSKFHDADYANEWALNPKVFANEVVDGKFVSNNSNIVWDSFLNQDMINILAHNNRARKKVLKQYEEVINKFKFKLMSMGSGNDMRHTVSILISNTIETFEIASRFSSDEPYCAYLGEIPEFTYAFLRSLVQFRLMLDVMPHTNKKIEGTPGEILPLPPHALFISGFFTGAFSFGLLLKVMYCRNLAHVIRSTFTLISDNPSLFDTVAKLGEKRAHKVTDGGKFEQIKSVFSKLINPHHQHMTGLSNDFINGLILILERCSLAFFRHVTIFLKVLTFDVSSGNAFYRLGNQIHDQLISPIESSFYDNDYPETLDPYCGFYKIPSVADLLLNLHENKEFETKIVENVFEGAEFVELGYPGVVKLIPLPSRLDVFTTDPESFFNVIKENGSRTQKKQKRDDDDEYGKGIYKDEKEKALHTRVDFLVCLHCGKKIFDHRRDKFSRSQVHSLKAHAEDAVLGKHNVFLDPNRNELHLGNRLNLTKQLYTHVNAPYINQLGESGVSSLNSRTFITLSEKRYKHIIKEYLIDGFSTHISRAYSSQRGMSFLERLEGIQGIQGLNDLLAGGGNQFGFQQGGEEDEEDEDEDEDDEERIGFNVTEFGEGFEDEMEDAVEDQLGDEQNGLVATMRNAEARRILRQEFEALGVPLVPLGREGGTGWVIQGGPAGDESNEPSEEEQEDDASDGVF